MTQVTGQRVPMLIGEPLVLRSTAVTRSDVFALQMLQLIAVTDICISIIFDICIFIYLFKFG